MSFLDTKAGPIRLISIVVIVGAVIALTRVLPFDRAFALLEGVIADLGIVGVLAFALVYVTAAVLFVPGSILTLAAGAIFGLAMGTAVVALSATTAAAVSFLIARYALRSKVEGLARSNPRFGAIDTAIAQGGWKIVGLLRLSPAIPFSIANYLFGLTRVRFDQYVITSLFTMLPGTFMYVYLGYIGRATATRSGGRTTGEWVLLGVGLLATIAVTVYVTKLAKKALAERTALDEASTDGEPAEDTQVGDEPRSKARGSLIMIGAAAAAVALAAVGTVKKDAISAAFGPPQVNLEEKFENREGDAVFDHSALDQILADHVDADGWVDYAAIGKRRAELDTYLGALAGAELETLGRDELLALYINAYNAATLALILDHSPLKSIKDIPRADRWDGVRWELAGKRYSLNQIEHELIRGQFKEPRIHFAVNCASIGCPPLRNEAFTGAKLEAQLEAQTVYVHTHPRWFAFDEASGKLELTRLYQWYAGDFEQVAGSAVNYAATYSPALARAKEAGKDIDREWLEYSWTLNSTDNAPADARNAEPSASNVGEPEPAKTAADPAVQATAEPEPTEPVVAGKPAGKAVTKKPANKTPAKKATNKTPAKKAANKTPAKKEPAKKEPAKKEPAKKEPAKKEPAGSGGGGSSSDGSSGGGGGGGSSGGISIPRGFQ